MRLLLLRSEAEIRVARDLYLLASAACRGVPAPRAGGPSAARNKRRRVPFRVPSFVLVAQRRRRWPGPPAGTPRFAPLVLDGALSRARPPYERIRVLRLEKKKGLRGVRVATAGLEPVTLTGCKPRESWARRARQAGCSPGNARGLTAATQPAAGSRRARALAETPACHGDESTGRSSLGLARRQ
jgi:hypothetical protein